MSDVFPSKRVTKGVLSVTGKNSWYADITPGQFNLVDSFWVPPGYSFVASLKLIET